MRVYLILILCFWSSFAFSQNQNLSGRLTDAEGNPLPGVSIVIKGTTVGTVTDHEGKYSIEAPAGSILVFSYIGFKTREVVVGEETGFHEKNEISANNPFPIDLFSDTASTIHGTGVFDENSPSYESSSPISITGIKKIRENSNSFKIINIQDPVIRKGFGLQYSQLYGITAVAKVPELQSKYAQGRSVEGMLRWRGPETTEPFSWGPKLDNLEYDGSVYPYDKKGRLVRRGNGNGEQARPYNNLNIFRKGFIMKHDLFFTGSISRKGTLSGGLNYDDRTGILPELRKKNLNLNLDATKISLGERGSLSLKTLYNQSEGNLLSHGANHARIIGAIYSAPTSFDNSNGLPPQKAVRSNESFTLENGTPRSYAPGLANNPYRLIALSPDNDQLINYLFGMSYNWERTEGLNTWKIDAMSSYNSQNLESVFGIPYETPGYMQGILTNREDQKDQLNFRFTPSYNYSKSTSTQLDLTFFLDYHSSYTSRYLERDDLRGTDPDRESPGMALSSKFEKERLINELKLSTHMKIANRLTLKLGNSSYFSSTVDQNDYINFFPFAGVRSKFWLWGMEVNTALSYSRAIQEANLIYNSWEYNSLLLNSWEYESVYELNELTPEGLLPETETKFDAVLDINYFYLANFELNYSYERIHNYIAPYSIAGNFRLENAATISNRILRVKFDFISNYWRTLRYNLGFRWSSQRPRVEEILTADEFLPLAGFNNVFTALSAGDPLGIIYGNYYRRDQNGNILIGSEGFPLVSEDLRALADPNPEWIMGIDGHLSWKFLKLSILFEVLYGGEVWNGTAARLDYLGRSGKTAKQRIITDFIFEGVNQEGEENSIPVNFYDPEEEVENNRWVRYGKGGVAEDYIEDATSVRMSEVNLSYSIAFPKNAFIQEFSLSLIGRNLFQITPYSGVDPVSGLFGYSLGNGLDLFNMPSVKSFNIKMRIKI